MIRAILLALLSIAGLYGSATAQTFTLPEIGLQNSGVCRQLAVRDRTNLAMVPIGCLDTSTHGWQFTPLKVVTSLGSAGASCATTDGAFATDGTQSWEPTCFGTWASATSSFFVYPTRGTDKNTDGTPKKNHTVNSLIQAKSIGDQGLQRTAQFINMDVVGGAYSGANADGQTNSTGQLISVRQHPDGSGNKPPSAWGANIDVHIGPGSGATQTYGVELDLNNFNANSGLGTGNLSAWYFYGGINAYPNLAFHYFGNPATTSYAGTVTLSGNNFTLASGAFSPLITTLSYAGTTYRVTCTTSVCTADYPVGTNSSPGAFTARSAMAHYGLFFQDSAGGSQVQDVDFFMVDSAQTILKAAGNHAIGIDFTGDALPNAALFKAGQNVCYNGLAGCMSFSSALNSWLFQSGTTQNSFVARVDTNGAGYFSNVTVSGALINSVLSPGAAGSTQGTASALTAAMNDVVVGAAGQGVRLNGSVGFRQEVFNSSGVTINVYPASGQQIGSAGANNPVSMASGAHAAFVCFSGTQCRQAP